MQFASQERPSRRRKSTRQSKERTSSTSNSIRSFSGTTWITRRSQVAILIQTHISSWRGCLLQCPKPSLLIRYLMIVGDRSRIRRQTRRKTTGEKCQMSQTRQESLDKSIQTWLVNSAGTDSLNRLRSSWVAVVSQSASLVREMWSLRRRAYSAIRQWKTRNARYCQTPLLLSF